jgi:hypothetical protein
VFSDDAAALFVRRDGSLRRQADALGYELLPAGNVRARAVAQECMRDPTIAARLTLELQRQERESNRTVSSEPLRELCEAAAAAAAAPR